MAQLRMVIMLNCQKADCPVQSLFQGCNRLFSNVSEVKVASSILALRMEIELQMEVGHPFLCVNQVIGFLLTHLAILTKQHSGEALPCPSRPVDDIPQSRFNFASGSCEIGFDNCHRKILYLLFLLDRAPYIDSRFFSGLGNDLFVDFGVTAEEVT